MIRNSLTAKLILSFMVVALISAAFVAVFMRLTSPDRLYQLIFEQQRSDLKTSLAEYYTAKGSWEDVAENWQEFRGNRRWTENYPQSPQDSTGNRPPSPDAADNNMLPPPDPSPNRERWRLFGLADAQGVVIVSVEPFFPLGSHVSPDTLENSTDIEVDGEQVGAILTAPVQPRFTPEESLFLQRTNQALILASITAIIAALAIAILLAPTLTRPLHELTQATQNMGQGNLIQQVNVRSQDEIGQLAKSFNQMSQEVYRVNQLRRQMTIDIAHDLRTPLTVIAGYIESMQEGILKPTPERLGLIYAEIERLQHLVEDLKILSLADSGELPLHPQQFSPKYLLDRAITPFRHPADQKKVNLQVASSENLPQICVDEARMMQVFSNLISNALRYTPDGGEIVLSAAQVGEMIKIIVKDTGQGISETDLPHIFERFYRADKSRSTDAGETGLGLAIAKALVEAQGGSIHAESTSGQGTIIGMEFPAAA